MHVHSMKKHEVNMANSSFRTIPKVQEKLLSIKRSEQINFSLYFSRMVSWEFKHGNENEFQKYTGEEVKHDRNGNVITDNKGNPKWEKQNDDYIKELENAGNDLLKGTSPLLLNKHKFQNDYIEALKESGVETFELRAKTTAPFITGLGSGHPTETGMVLDRNTGLPYIPASSIKGVLRLSQAIKCADENGNVDENDERIVKYFGTTSDAQDAKRGQLIILDAYPDSERVPKLKIDIMNPHFSAYYAKKIEERIINGRTQRIVHDQPVETESPVPIKFLTVKEGTAFVFRCAFIPLGNKILSENDRQEIQKNVDAMFDTAFETVGFGGKTAIGYGRFKRL